MERWSKLKIGTEPFIGKFDRNSSETVESFTFWLSDFKTLWNECINSKDNLLQRLTDDNPAMVISDEISDQLISALNTLGSTAQMNTNIKTDDEEFKLQFKLSLGEGISVQFHWLLKKCEPQMFFEQVTKSLLHQIGELQEDKKQLIDIVKKKDDEIRQHKLEGAQPLARTKYITEVFDANEFTSRPQMLNCEVDEFQSIIGPLSKNLIRSEEKKVVVSPIKPMVIQNRGGRNRKRRLFQKLVKPGDVKYDSGDDDEESTAVRADDQINTEEPVKAENQINAEEPINVEEPIKEEEPMNAEEPINTEAAINIEEVESAPKPTKPSPIKRIRRKFNL